MKSEGKMRIVEISSILFLAVILVTSGSVVTVFATRRNSSDELNEDPDPENAEHSSLQEGSDEMVIFQENFTEDKLREEWYVKDFEDSPNYGENYWGLSGSRSSIGNQSLNATENGDYDGEGYAYETLTDAMIDIDISSELNFTEANLTFDLWHDIRDRPEDFFAVVNKPFPDAPPDPIQEVPGTKRDGKSDGWEHMEVTIPTENFNLTNESLGFRFSSGGELIDTNPEGVYIDNITLSLQGVEFPEPVARLGEDRTVDEEEIVIFDASDSELPESSLIEGYEWNFGDGTHMPIGPPLMTYNYTEPGTYTVEMTVTDALGRKDSDTVNITVEEGTGTDVLLVDWLTDQGVIAARHMDNKTFPMVNETWETPPLLNDSIERDYWHEINSGNDFNIITRPPVYRVPQLDEPPFKIKTYDIVDYLEIYDPEIVIISDTILNASDMWNFDMEQRLSLVDHLEQGNGLMVTGGSLNDLRLKTPEAEMDIAHWNHTERLHLDEAENLTEILKYYRSSLTATMGLGLFPLYEEVREWIGQYFEKMYEEYKEKDPKIASLFFAASTVAYSVPLLPDNVPFESDFERVEEKPNITEGLGEEFSLDLMNRYTKDEEISVGNITGDTNLTSSGWQLQYPFLMAHHTINQTTEDSYLLDEVHDSLMENWSKSFEGVNHLFNHPNADFKFENLSQPEEAPLTEQEMKNITENITDTLLQLLGDMYRTRTDLPTQIEMDFNFTVGDKNINETIVFPIPVPLQKLFRPAEIATVSEDGLGSVLKYEMDGARYDFEGEESWEPPSNFTDFDNIRDSILNFDPIDETPVSYRTTYFTFKPSLGGENSTTMVKNALEWLRDAPAPEGQELIGSMSVPKDLVGETQKNLSEGSGKIIENRSMLLQKNETQSMDITVEEGGSLQVYWTAAEGLNLTLSHDQKDIVLDPERYEHEDYQSAFFDLKESGNWTLETKVNAEGLKTPMMTQKIEGEVDEKKYELTVAIETQGAAINYEYYDVAGEMNTGVFWSPTGERNEKLIEVEESSNVTLEVEIMEEYEDELEFKGWTGDYESEEPEVEFAVEENMTILATFLEEEPDEEEIKIYDWHDLDEVRNDLSGDYILMNDLDKDTAGYDEYNAQREDYEVKEYAEVRGSWNTGDTIEIHFDEGDYDSVLSVEDENGNAISHTVGESTITIDEDTGGGSVYVTYENAVVGWDPIGEYHYDEDVEFTGTFDGNGHEISDLYINRPDLGVVGLFGGTKGETEISHLGLVDTDVTGGHAVGGLVGLNNGTVSKSYVKGEVTGFGVGIFPPVGGLVGWNGPNGIVVNSYTTSIVSGETGVGGLTGWNFDGTVRNSYASGDVNGEEGAIGGLVGANAYGGTVENSYATGDVSGNESIGGLIGINEEEDTESIVENSYATGEVSGKDEIGGLVGNNTGTVSDSFSLDSPVIGEEKGTQQGRVTAVEKSEMKDKSLYTQISYSDYDDLEEPWDFVGNPNNDEGDEDIWNIDEDGEINDGYPFLAWEGGGKNGGEEDEYFGFFSNYWWLISLIVIAAVIAIGIVIVWRKRKPPNQQQQSPPPAQEESYQKQPSQQQQPPQQKPPPPQQSAQQQEPPSGERSDQ